MMTTRQAFEEAYEKANGDYCYIRIRPDLSVGSDLIKNPRHAQVLLNLDSIFLVFLQDDEATIMKDNRPSHWEPFKFESKTGTALKPLPAYARSTFESACELREDQPYYVHLREDLSVGQGPIRGLAHAKALPTMDGVFLVFVEDGKVTIMKDNRPSHWEPFKFEKKDMPALTRTAFEAACDAVCRLTTLKLWDRGYVRIHPNMSVFDRRLETYAQGEDLVHESQSIFLVFVEDGKVTIMKDNRPSHWEPFKFEKKSDWSSPINKKLVASEAVRILRDLASPMEFWRGCRPPENWVSKTAGGWFEDRPTHLTVPAKKGEAAFTVEDRKAIAGKELDKLVEARVAVRQWVKF